MWAYAKCVAAVATAGLEAAQTALPLTPVQHGWVTVALAALGAVAVYVVPNRPARTGSRRRADG